MKKCGASKPAAKGMGKKVPAVGTAKSGSKPGSRPGKGKGK